MSCGSSGEIVSTPATTLVQVNACPTEEELQYTYTGYCSDNAMAYANKTDSCVRYEDYRKLKNLARWESKDGRFDGYVSCDLPRAQWFEMVQSRPSAASRGLQRDDRILLMDISGPETALVKVACQLPPRYFTDYLVLNRTSEGWRIVSKVYRFETRD